MADITTFQTELDDTLDQAANRQSEIFDIRKKLTRLVARLSMNHNRKITGEVEVGPFIAEISESYATDRYKITIEREVEGIFKKNTLIMKHYFTVDDEEIGMYTDGVYFTDDYADVREFVTQARIRLDRDAMLLNDIF